MDDVSPTSPPFPHLVKRWMMDDSRALVRLFLAGAFGTLLSLVVPHASRIIFDQALPDASPRLMGVVAGCLLVLGAHQAWVKWIQSSLTIGIAANVERRGLERAVEAMVYCGEDVLEQKNAGWMMTTLQGVSDTTNRYVNGYRSLVTQGMMSAGYLMSMGAFSPMIASIVVLWTLLLAALSYLAAQVEASHVRERLDRAGEQQQMLYALLASLASMRGLFATDRLTRNWKERVRASEKANLRSERVGVGLDVLQSVGSQVLSVGVLIWAIVSCFDGQLTVGEMMFLTTTSAGLAHSTKGVLDVLVQFKAIAPYARRVDELIRGASKRPAQLSAAPLHGEILVDEVWFRYDRELPWVIKNHTWRLERGEMVHLKARSGAGKTTLLRLIAGLETPTRGSVSVFGQNPTHARDLVLYVPQHCDLFETSVRENLELLSSAPRADILHAAHLTGLSRMLEALPMGEETLVSARGQNLSSGQRQLVILTAAFASSRPVLLLDEATSQMDDMMRRRCQWDLLVQGRTVVRVEHG